MMLLDVTSHSWRNFAALMLSLWEFGTQTTVDPHGDQHSTIFDWKHILLPVFSYHWHPLTSILPVISYFGYLYFGIIIPFCYLLWLSTLVTRTLVTWKGWAREHVVHWFFGTRRRQKRTAQWRLGSQQGLALDVLTPMGLEWFTNRLIVVKPI